MSQAPGTAARHARFDENNLVVRTRLFAETDAGTFGQEIPTLVTTDLPINDDMMIYGLYSEGFRPGGTNRGRGLPYFPQQYNSDKLRITSYNVCYTKLLRC